MLPAATSNGRPGVDTFFDGQDGPSNSFKGFKVDRVCRVFFMFVGIRLYGVPKWTSNITGRPGTFFACVTIVMVWALSGPIFAFSDSWQLVINTGTTIVTFLMVFLIQNTQNRDTAELHLKLDELIRATKGARKLLLDLDELDDKQLERLRVVYERLGQKARHPEKS